MAAVWQRRMVLLLRSSKAVSLFCTATKTDQFNRFSIMPYLALFATSLSPLNLFYEKMPNQDVMISMRHEVGHERKIVLKFKIYLNKEVITTSLLLSRTVSSHCAWLFFISSSFFCTLLKLSSNTCCGIRPIKILCYLKKVKGKKNKWKDIYANSNLIYRYSLFSNCPKCTLFAPPNFA